MNKKQILQTFGIATIAAAAGFGVKAIAGGIPTPQPLWYAGTLAVNGQPVNSSAVPLTVNLWLNPAITSGESVQCTTTATVPVANGRFRIQLAALCQQIVAANQNVYVEVVDNGTSLGRSPIGAVPYAVEANHAVNADNALNSADGGTIASSLASLNASVAALQPTSLVGTYPAVFSPGVIGPPTPLTSYLYVCGKAPTSLTVLGTAPDAGSSAWTDTFGSLLFTRGGQLELNLAPPPEACTTTSAPGYLADNMCGPPVTFFLISPTAQSINVGVVMDDLGSVYVDGTAVVTGIGTGTATFPIPQGPFALTFLACSNNGPSIWMQITSSFIETYGLSIDFNRTFHRGL